MTPAAFEDGYKLADTEVNPLLVPEGTEMRQFQGWVNRLPEREPPTYLGLPANAEKLLLVEHGREMIKNLERVVGVMEEGESMIDEPEVGRVEEIAA
jgi:dynein heavy chain 1, cytosolic